MIFKYELRFVAFTFGVHMAESLLVGRNFVSGICKLKPLKKTFKFFLKAKKNL